MDHRYARLAVLARGLHREPALAIRLLDFGLGFRERLGAQGREIDDAVHDRPGRLRHRLDDDGFGRFDDDGFGRFDDDRFGGFGDGRCLRDGSRRHVRCGCVLFRRGVDRRRRLERGGERGLDPDRGPFGVTALLAGGPAVRLVDRLEDRLDDRRRLRQELGILDERGRREQLGRVEQRWLGNDFGLLDGRCGFGNLVDHG